MKAKINHGQRGKRIDQLVKEYEFEYPREFYNYILESYEDGHHDQVIELFNQMKEYDQKSFLLNCMMTRSIYGEKIHDLIIKSL